MKRKQLNKIILNHPWLIKPSVLDEMAQKVLSDQEDITPEDDQEEPDDKMPECDDNGNPMMIKDGVAYIPIQGIICSTKIDCGEEEEICYIELIEDLINQAVANKEVKSIVFVVNSPGGYSMGVDRLANLIRSTNYDKKCFGYVTGQCCSAAYYLLAGCEGIYACEDSEIGSIGVYSVFYEVSAAYEAMGIKINILQDGKYKIAGNSMCPMNDAEKEYLQSSINKTGTKFREFIKMNRLIDDNAMQGQVYDTEDAIKANFIDGVIEDIECINQLTK